MGAAKAKSLGVAAALMIVTGYYGELFVSGDLLPRWVCWFMGMVFFLYIVYELLVGLAEVTNSEADPEIKSKIQLVQVMTVISWCTYPVVYLVPILVSRLPKPWWVSRSVIACLTSSPSAAWDLRSTKSRTPSPPKRVCSRSEREGIDPAFFSGTRLSH